MLQENASANSRHIATLQREGSALIKSPIAARKCTRMSRTQISCLCHLCAALFTEDKSVIDAETDFDDQLLWHRDVSTLEASAEYGCSLCLTILRGFPPPERAWAHKYLNLASEDERMNDPRGRCKFTERDDQTPGYNLDLFYPYLPPSEDGAEDTFYVQVSLIPFEGKSEPVSDFSFY